MIIQRLRRRLGAERRRLRHRWTTWREAFDLILIYHRVTPDVELDWNLLCVTPANLAGQLEWLQAHFELAALTDLLQPRRGRPRVALTFDDGYADNLHQALPVLEQFGVPATVFVTSGRIDADGEFWWDELERLVFLTRLLPPEIEFEIPGGRCKWRVDPDGGRGRLYQQIHAVLKPLDAGGQEQLLAQLRPQFPDRAAPRADHRALTRAELKRLAASPLVSIGAHTVHHPTLAARPQAEQEKEVRESVETLRAWTGQPVTTFSYPFGTPDDIGPRSSEFVAGSGCILARANVSGLVTARSNRFALPGLLVRNWPPGIFASRLTQFLESGAYDAGAA